MQRIAQFEKVSRDRFRADWAALHPTQAQEADALYDALLLPRRATSGSAGYDFYLPHDLTLAPGASVLLPTGVRARIATGWVLLLAPRSSLGFKFRLQLNNTVGVIDSDYYHSDNEGHIMAKLLNDGREGKSLVLKAGTAFMQGLFLPFGITEDDDATQLRNGGFGSTSEAVKA